MILRGLARSLKEQNWTAIAIEFVLLVLGVFLGIQASNWNTSETERRQARDAMQRLQDDMQQSFELTGQSMIFMAGNARGADLVFDSLRSCHLAEQDRDAFATGLYRLGKITPARFVRTTFDELRDSGRLDLIGDDKLRHALNETARMQDSHEAVFRLIAARTDPHMAYVDSHVIYLIHGAIGGGAQIRWNQLDIDFDAACKDRRFQAAVAAVRNYTYDDLADVTRQQQRFEDILGLIKQERAR
ncbi:MAG: hypothetical protein IT472_00365 [Thermomonas sp.]|uniref:hypothetical protein n=1 Tax=Thermomonas sp. TaxID=1971895 RepID=UPI00263242A1|nr:hypothetical protein [Thermomonas sp.]MCC7095621.1 hypothetical protein [Thermomonas sp.]